MKTEDLVVVRKKELLRLNLNTNEVMVNHKPLTDFLEDAFNAGEDSGIQLEAGNTFNSTLKSYLDKEIEW